MNDFLVTLCSSIISLLTIFATFLTALATWKSASATKKSASATERSVKQIENVRKHTDEIKMLQFRNEMCKFEQECKNLYELPNRLCQGLHLDYTAGQFTKELQSKPIIITFDWSKWGDDGIAELLLLCCDEATATGYKDFQKDSLYDFICDIYDFKKELFLLVKTLTNEENKTKKLSLVCKQLVDRIPSDRIEEIKENSCVIVVTVEHYINIRINNLLKKYEELNKYLNFAR